MESVATIGKQRVEGISDLELKGEARQTVLPASRVSSFYMDVTQAPRGTKS